MSWSKIEREINSRNTRNQAIFTIKDVVGDTGVGPGVIPKNARHLFGTSVTGWFIQTDTA